jgi:2'-5' RNA ligase
LTEPEQPPLQRLFFALWPDADTRAALHALQREPGPASGRPVHPEDIHQTLVFLGQVEAGRLPCVLAAADQVRASAVTLELTRLGYWRGPRVAWAAPAETPPDLLDLVDQLWGGLAVCGFDRETRPFQSHVTLARKARSFPTATLERPIPWKVRDFVLVTSLSVPEPPRYQVLQRWPLSEG